MVPTPDTPTVLSVVEMQDKFEVSLAEICRASRVPYKTLQRWKQYGAPPYELFLLENTLENILRKSPKTP